MFGKLFLLLVFLLTPLSAQAGESIVSFTFDDAPKSVVTIGLPILESADYTATVYIATNNTKISEYMDWSDIALLAKKGWEIGAHTLTHPNLTTLSDDEITRELETSNRELAAHGYPLFTFASPFGAYDDRVLAIIKRYYTSHRTAWPNGVNTLTPDPYNIISYGVTHDSKIEDINNLLSNLQNNGGWVVFQLHHLTKKGDTVIEKYGTNLLEDIVEQVHAKGMTVLTVSDAIKHLKGAE